MSNTAQNRYNSGWAAKSKLYRALYSCAVCGSDDNKETHHRDGCKRNDAPENIVVLCRKHHQDVDEKRIPCPDVVYPALRGISVTVARTTSSGEEWFNPTLPLKIAPGIPAARAMAFRRRHLKAFIVPAHAQYYIGVLLGDKLVGIAAFTGFDYGVCNVGTRYDLVMKADTVPSEWAGAKDLLLFAVRTKEMRAALEKRFCREIARVVTYCHSPHRQINAYRKHATLDKATQSGDAWRLVYSLEMGSIVSLKDAKAKFMQQNKRVRKDEQAQH